MSGIAATSVYPNAARMFGQGPSDYGQPVADASGGINSAPTASTGNLPALSLLGMIAILVLLRLVYEWAG